MQHEDEAAETLRRVDALGDAGLSQALREALARRSINAQQDGCRSEDAWRADEDAWTRMINDEANVRHVVPPFALLQLNTDVRRKVLAFLICASQDHALRAIAARAPERPDATRCLTPSPKPSGTVEVFSSNRCTSTTLYGTVPRSTAASVPTLLHHTAALRVICREIRTDAVALASAATSTATPRSWLANLYCRRDPALDDEAVVRELRARVLSGRRANTVRELFLRKDACSNFTPPEYSGDGWITRWTNKSRQCYDDFLGCTNQLLAECWHDSSQTPITALEDLMANDTDSIGNMDLTKPAFMAKIDVEFADDAEPSLVEDGWGVRSFSYTLGASSMKAQAGTLAKLGCMIKVDCDDGAIDSVELFINFLAEEELADGYFMARVQARIPGFD